MVTDCVLSNRAGLHMLHCLVLPRLRHVLAAHFALAAQFARDSPCLFLALITSRFDGATAAALCRSCSSTTSARGSWPTAWSSSWTSCRARSQHAGAR
eukprot:4127968-Pleurochrysis_carterae.AAC.2